MHWRHEILESPHGRFLDPQQGQIGSNYWPSRGLYSSADPVVLRAQLTDIAEMGIGVMFCVALISVCVRPIVHSHASPSVYSWWGQNLADQQGRAGRDDRILVQLMDIAAEVSHIHNSSLVFHVMFLIPPCSVWHLCRVPH